MYLTCSDPPSSSPCHQACAAIMMSCSDHDVVLPDAWWEAFIGVDRGTDLSTVCNSILAVCDESDLDSRRARYAFLPSLLKDESFNDPESYIWSVLSS